MAEVAAASSIVSLVDFSGKILAAGYSFLAKVARAPTEIRTLLNDVANVNTLLARMQSLANDTTHPNAKTVLKSLSDRGIFKSCEILLKTAEKCLGSCRQIDGNQSKNFGRALKWPLTERETRDTMQQLRALQDQLTAALTIDSAATLQRIDKSARELNVLATATKDNTDALLNQEKNRKLIHWVTPESIDPHESYESALRLRRAETGKWFLRSAQFEDFLESNGGLFWVHGNPGSGKTVLMSTVIEYLRSELAASDSDFGLTYFFCEERDHKKQLLKNLLSVLVAQLIRSQPICISEVEAAKSKSDRSLTEADYIKLLLTITTYFQKIFIIVDALDESTEARKISHAYSELLNPSQKHAKMFILTTSREDVNIQRLLAPLATCQLSLVNRMGGDIRTYVTAEVEERIRLRTMKLRDAALATEIVDCLVDRADGVFLQAKVQLEYVSNLKSDGAIKKALRNLPSGLDDTYERILSEILSKTPSEAQQVKAVLQWLVGSYDLLTLDQLAEAVSIQVQDTRLDRDMIFTDPEDLVALCRSLAVVDRSLEPPVVALAHFSVKEYLQSDRIALSSARFFQIKDSQVHCDLANACIQYLSFDDFADTAPKTDLATLRSTAILSSTYPLLRYAAEHWPKHLRACDMSADEFIRIIRPRLCWFLEAERGCAEGDKIGHQYSSWLGLWHFVCMACLEYNGCHDGCFYQPPIYHAILFGLEHVFDVLLPHFHDINNQFRGGWTPLTAALSARHSRIAKDLLHAGADPNVPASNKIKSLTPLHVAAENAMEDMVEALLRAGADPHARTTTGTTPFYRAARGGSMRILQMLYDAGADVNARTWDNWTALCEPILDNRVDVVQQLLLWGADCNVASIQDMTPYSLAVSLGRQEIVEVLKDKTSPEHRSARTMLVDHSQGDNTDGAIVPEQLQLGSSSVRKGIGTDFRTLKAVVTRRTVKSARIHWSTSSTVKPTLPGRWTCDRCGCNNNPALCGGRCVQCNALIASRFGRKV